MQSYSQLQRDRVTNLHLSQDKLPVPTKLEQQTPATTFLLKRIPSQTSSNPTLLSPLKPQVIPPAAMDGNRDDAERCLQLAEAALANNDKHKAQRLLDKSKRMYPLPDVQARVQARIKLHVPSSTRESSSSSSSRSDPRDPRESNENADADATREPTTEMKSAVRKVQSAENHYEVLGIARDADEASVKRAYKKLALQLHPDRNCATGSDEAFKRVGNAFLVLSDRKRRAHYDRFGESVGDEVHEQGERGREGLRRRRGGGGGGGWVRRGGGGEYVYVGGDMTADELFEFLFRSAGEDLSGGGGRRRAREEARAARGGAGDAPGAWMKLFVYMIVMMFVFWALGGEGRRLYSLEKTKHHRVTKVSGNGVIFYMAEESKVAEGREMRNLERRVDMEALERWMGMCEAEERKERTLLYESRRWRNGKSGRARYRKMYEEFRKPWCGKAMELRGKLNRQGYTLF